MSSARLNNTTAPSTPAAGKTVLYVDEADKHLKQKDDTGAVTDLTDATGLTEKEFADKVGGQTDLTGIIPIDDIISLNADIKKINIVAFDYFIQGVYYEYVGGTAISPTIGVGDSSTWVGIDSSSIVYSDNAFTNEETKTILPLARLQAVQGQSGSNSDLQEPLHLAFAIGQEGYNERQWIEHSIGVLYASGGTYSENTGTPLQVDQDAGVFYNAQRRRMEVSLDANIEASRVYHVGGAPTVQNRATLVIPKYYDNGTDIVALPIGKFASHTLLRSPKEGDLFFLVYGSTFYDSQAQAESANAEYSVFQGQSISGLYKVARFVIGGDSTNIEAIQDERPKFILEDESTGTGIQDNSYCCMYIDTPIATEIAETGTFIKVAGSTTEVASSADFTVGTNRFTYTGTTTRRFKLDIASSMTSVNNNQVVRGRFAVNGVTILASEQEKTGVGTNVGTIPLSCVPELSTNDYVEYWVANTSGAGNITVRYMNMNLISVD